MHGREMASARGPWRAMNIKEEDFGKPIIAVVSSFTHPVPGSDHVCLLDRAVPKS